MKYHWEDAEGLTICRYLITEVKTTNKVEELDCLICLRTIDPKRYKKEKERIIAGKPYKCSMCPKAFKKISHWSDKHLEAHKEAVENSKLINKTTTGLDILIQKGFDDFEEWN